MKAYMLNTRLKVFILFAFSLLLTNGADAQYTWSNTSGAAWSNGGNWGGTTPTIATVGQFSVAPTTSPTITISGTTSAGAISVLPSRTTSLSFSGTVMSLTGAAIGSSTGVVIANLGSSIVNVGMPISLGANKVILASAGTTSLVAGSTISITGAITANTGTTFLGGGTWDGTNGLCGGLLRLAANNTALTGSITIGSSTTATGSGTLEVGTTSAISNANGVSINNYSQLYLGIGGSFTSGTLTLNGGGNASPNGRGALRSSGSTTTWTSSIALATNSVIYTGNTLTLSGTVGGTGQLIKEGPGALMLTGFATSLTFSGGLKISEGAVGITRNGYFVNPVDIVFAQNINNSTTLTLTNGTSHTISSLSSTFSNTSGSYTQTLALVTNCSLTINQSSNTTFGYGATTSLSSIITGGSGGFIIKTGIGSLTFNGWPHTFYGGLTITDGAIVLAPSASISVASGSNYVPINMNGGTLSTSGIATSVTCSLGVLNNIANSTIALDATKTHVVRFNSLGTNTGVISITGWQGAYDGTTGTKGKFYIGSTTTSVSSTNLAQFQFVDGSGNVVPAVQIAGGEIVPKIPFNIVTASYGPFFNNVNSVISVSYSTPATYFTGNFRVQLSSSTGVFANTTSNIIGTGAWATSGTITATIPSGTTAGAGYRVRVLTTTPYVIASADNGSNISLNVPVPTVTSVSATINALPGSTISITGSVFNATPANNIVYFGAVKAIPTSGSTTTLNVTVPFGATYGQLTVYDTITKYAGHSSVPFLPSFDASFFITDSISFQPRFDYITGSNPVIAAIGDLDGDGLPDMVALNKTGTSLKILQNQGTGVAGFTQSSAMALQGSGPLNVKIGDIDGDGRNDIVVAGGSGSGTVQIFRNLSNFSSATTPRTLLFDTRKDISITAQTPSAGVLAIGDLDGDGRLDIAVAAYSNIASTGNMVVLKNNNSPGAVTSFSMTSYNAGFVYNPTSSSICIGDFNNDRLPDIAVTNQVEASYPGSISVFKNTSTPNAMSFATAVNVPTGAYLIDIQAVDVDGDNLQDLIVTEAIDNSISLYKNTYASPATGLSFGSQQIISNTLSTPAGFSVGDLDADGKPDLAVVNFVPSGSVSIFKNTSSVGTPSFVNSNNITAAPYPTGINIADIDKDGYPDLITGNTSFDVSYVGTTVSVYRNTPVPIVGTISSTSDSMCVGSTTTLSYSLTLPTGMTGAWSSSDTTKARVNSAGVVTGISAGTVDISYTATVTRGNISRSVVRTVVVKALPAVNVTGFRGVCNGVTTTLTGSPSGGSWTHSTSVTTVSSGGGVTGAAASGTDIITYSYTSPSTGCSNVDTHAMIIILPPNPGTISGADSICPGVITTMTTSGDAGGKWYSDNIYYASIDSLSGIVTGVSNGSPIINYKIANGCGIFNVYKMVSVLPLPDAGTITGPSTVCTGSNISLTNAVAGGVWSSSNVALATVSASGIVYGIGTGVPSISFTRTNSCGSTSALQAVTVNTIPGAPPAITGATTVCIGSVTSLNNASTGGTWSSSDTSLATVTASTGFVSAITWGSPQISYTVSNACGTSAPALTTINILNYPTAAITSAIVPCDGYSSDIVFTGTPNAIVSVSVDGGTSIDGTLTGGVYSLPTGIITSLHTYQLQTVRNVACAYLIDTTVTLIPQQMTWLGGAAGAETRWDTAANWSCGSVPLVTDNVLIPSVTFLPAVASGANTRNLVISAFAGMTVEAGATLNIKGNLTTNGYIDGAGTAVLSGAALQTISGSGTIVNLSLNNTSGAEINVGSHLIISKSLSIAAGTLNTNDSLELASTDTVATARIAELPASGAMIAGNVVVNQHVMGGYRRYRFISHPFSDTISLSQLQQYIDITGPGGSANGFRSTSSNAPSAFRLDPMTSNSLAGYDPGWKPFTKINSGAADTNKFHPGQGLRVFFRGAKGEGLAYLGYSGGYTPSATTFKMKGHVNQGPVTLTLRKGIIDPANQEFNMVGNPYPSPVDIGTIIYNASTINQVVGSAFYVWDPSIGAGGQYIAIAIGTTAAIPYYIQANTAFQVRAHHDGAILSFEESHKSANTSHYLFREQSKYVALNVYDANDHLWDMLKINFIDEASDNDDAKMDATKPMGSDFAFYSTSADGHKLTIDARPFTTEKVIPLGIRSNYMQDFIIRADNMAVPEGGTLVLHDKLLQQYVEMKEGTEYRFSIGAEKNTQGERFELALKPAGTKNNTLLTMTMTPNPATDRVSIAFTAANAENVSVNVADMSGVNVYSGDVGKVQNGAVNISLEKFAAGIYIIELTHGNEKVTRKLVKE